MTSELIQTIPFSIMLITVPVNLAFAIPLIPSFDDMFNFGWNRRKTILAFVVLFVMLAQLSHFYFSAPTEPNVLPPPPPYTDIVKGWSPPTEPGDAK